MPRSGRTKARALDPAALWLEKPEEYRTAVGTAMDLCEEARQCEAEDRWADALEIYDTVVRDYGATAETELLATVASALVNKCRALATLGRNSEVVAVCDDILYRFDGPNEPAFRARITYAMLSKGAALERLDHPELAIAEYEKLADRYGRLEPYLWVAEARARRVILLDRIGRSDEALIAAEDLLRRYDGWGAPGLEGYLVQVLRLKARHLEEAGRLREAVRIYRKAAERLSREADAWLRTQVAMAYLDEAVAECNLGRVKDAMKAVASGICWKSVTA